MPDCTSEREQWLPVVGHEGVYDVSDQGRVRSRPRTIIRRNGQSVARAGRYLHPTIDSGGYPGVKLTGPSGQRTERIHVLILTAFVGPCPPAFEGCHNNGVRADSVLSNLRWDSHAGNMADRRLHGTSPIFKTHCVRGHLLIGPNLCASRRGMRQCKACDNARRVAKTWSDRVSLDLAEEADRQYERIMTGSPSNRGKPRLPRARKSQCSRGHALTEPNLCGVERRCKACVNAKSTAQYQLRANGVVVDRAAESQRQYARIMGLDPSPTVT